MKPQQPAENCMVLNPDKIRGLYLFKEAFCLSKASFLIESKNLFPYLNFSKISGVDLHTFYYRNRKDVTHGPH